MMELSPPGGEVARGYDPRTAQPPPLGDLDSEKIVSRLLGRLGARRSGNSLEGGSSADVLAITGRDGKPYVLKVATPKGGTVDGQDLESFWKKAEQTWFAAEFCPELGPHLNEIVHAELHNRWAAYIMPWYEVEDFARPLRHPNPNVPALMDELECALEILGEHGYGRKEFLVPAKQNEAWRTHIHRVLRRGPLIDRAFPDGGFLGGRHGAELVINGVPCRSSYELLREMSKDPALMEALKPDNLSFPVHGDLNTRNLLRRVGADRDKGFILVDQRGTLDRWDATYDLGKLLFCFTGWDAGLRHGFEIEQHRDSHGMARFDVALRNGGYEGYRQAARAFPEMVSGLQHFGDALAPADTLQLRLLFTNAVHLLSEVACRLSDLKERTVDGQVISPQELAEGLYLSGTLLLNDFYEQWQRSESVGTKEHFALLL